MHYSFSPGIFVLFFVCTHATTYYIASSGNDGAAGTSSTTPWQTIGVYPLFQWPSPPPPPPPPPLSFRPLFTYEYYPSTFSFDLASRIYIFIGKLNSVMASLRPGDSVLFNRGMS